MYIGDKILALLFRQARFWHSDLYPSLTDDFENWRLYCLDRPFTSSLHCLTLDYKDLNKMANLVGSMKKV